MNVAASTSMGAFVHPTSFAVLVLLPQCYQWTHSTLTHGMSGVKVDTQHTDPWGVLLLKVFLTDEKHIG